MRTLVALSLSAAPFVAGCSQQKESPPETGEPIRFVRLQPVRVVCGDPNGCPVEDHVAAIDASGNPVTDLAFNPGRAVVLKHYATTGDVGSGLLRVYAPAESCAHLDSDWIGVVAYDQDGTRAEAELPVEIIHRTTPPMSSPPAPLAPGIRITAPEQGSVVAGVVHTISGTAPGYEQVEVLVRSATGAYSQGIAPVVDGRFSLPVYLGEEGPGRGEGEHFEILASSVDGGVVSAPVRVFRTR